MNIYRVTVSFDYARRGIWDYHFNVLNLIGPLEVCWPFRIFL